MTHTQAREIKDALIALRNAETTAIHEKHGSPNMFRGLTVWEDGSGDGDESAYKLCVAEQKAVKDHYSELLNAVNEAITE